jgi:hypothetical protein
VNETTPSQAAIARAIGVAKSRITALKAQGMPVHSIEAAQAWRRTHLNPARTKPPPRPPAHPAPSPAVLVAQDLMEAAGLVLAAGGSIEPLIPGLRRALRAVPPHQRDDVELNPEVMRVLLAPLLALIDSEKAASPDTTEPQPEDDEAKAEAGSWLYAIACGEVKFNPPD